MEVRIASDGNRGRHVVALLEFIFEPACAAVTLMLVKDDTSEDQAR